jgi:hypothetical protein
VLPRATTSPRERMQVSANLVCRWSVKSVQRRENAGAPVSSRERGGRLDKLGVTGSSPVPPIISSCMWGFPLPKLATDFVSHVLVTSRSGVTGPSQAPRRVTRWRGCRGLLSREGRLRAGRRVHRGPARPKQAGGARQPDRAPEPAEPKRSAATKTRMDAERRRPPRAAGHDAP